MLYNHNGLDIAGYFGNCCANCIFDFLLSHFELDENPRTMKGAPIALVTAGLLALAFMGFTGLIAVLW